MDKIKKALLDFFTIIGGLAVIWEYIIKPLKDKPANISLMEYYSHINWVGSLGIIMLVVVMLIMLAKQRNYEKSIKILKENQLTTDSSFLKLNTDFMAMTHYFQGDLSLLASNYKIAYYNFILSIKYSIMSGNVQNVPRALKMIKDSVLPKISKNDIEMLKRDTSLDIQEMFNHIASVDKDRVFALAIQEIIAIINRLPQTAIA